MGSSGNPIEHTTSQNIPTCPVNAPYCNWLHLYFVNYFLFLYGWPTVPLITVVLGGMLLPVEMPLLSPALLSSWRGRTYREVCYSVLRLFIPPEEMLDNELHDVVGDSFKCFGIPEVVRIIPLQTETGVVNVCELWHGPTLAFKDLGMQVGCWMQLV